MTKQGSIVRWDATRAFGFIRSADSAGDVFFHIRDYRGSAPPREGLAVVFEEIHVGGKGPRAMAVRTASSPQRADDGAHNNDSRNPGGRTQHTTPARRSAPARSTGRRQGQAPSPATGASLAYGLMLAWAALLAWGVWTQRLPLWTLAALAALNVVTLRMYAADKNAARAGRWRIPESNLHLLSLLGGWPAAWLAQQSMRHKSSKAEFRAVYWVTIVLHCGALAWVVLTKTQLPLSF
ncbi:MAG: DUF1294 domain-containing protein [Giesbergeria sp.]